MVTLPPEKNKKMISETNDQDSVLVWGQNFFASAYPTECFYAQSCDFINCPYLLVLPYSLPVMGMEVDRMEPRGPLNLYRRQYFSTSYSSLTLNDLIFQASGQIEMQPSS